MNADTALTIISILDKADRALGAVRLFPTHGTLSQRLASNRQALSQAREHLEQARALA